MKGRSHLLMFLFGMAVFLSSCSLISLFREQDEFITVRDGRFYHGGQPYYFAGTNMWYGAYLGSPGATGDRERLRRELDYLNAMGVTNLRVLAASELSPIRRAMKPAIQTSPGVYDDSLLAGLDFLLAEMAKRDMHAVLYLGNYWEWSGGFTQYNMWTGASLIDPEITGHAWSEYMDSAATFYSNAEAQQIFRKYIEHILRRKNRENGRVYAKDPTIMAWQLANEPRPGAAIEFGTATLPDFYRWINETVSFIDSLDPNHLISTGSEGVIGTLASEEYFQTAHGSVHVDYLTFHLWPHIWRWYDPDRAQETMDSTEIKTREYIFQHIALGRSMNKPAVMEEFGFLRDRREISTGTATQGRDRFYRFVFALIEDSAAAGAPIAGSNFWAWGGEGSGMNPDGMWRQGDPYLGDPPQEPQGLHSVFASDSSTLEIIRAHAAKLRVRGAQFPLQ